MRCESCLFRVLGRGYCTAIGGKAPGGECPVDETRLAELLKEIPGYVLVPEAVARCWADSSRDRLCCACDDNAECESSATHILGVGADAEH